MTDMSFKDHLLQQADEDFGALKRCDDHDAHRRLLALAAGGGRALALSRGR
jgi:hypothetical protein